MINNMYSNLASKQLSIVSHFNSCTLSQDLPHVFLPIHIMGSFLCMPCVLCSACIQSQNFLKLGGASIVQSAFAIGA